MRSNWEGIFPQDVVNEILIWMPIKSLLRFKCVCKYWYAVIKSPVFVTKHFNHEDNHTRLLLYCNKGNFRASVSLLSDEILVSAPSQNDIVDHIYCPQIVDHIIGPIDGLFFLHGGLFGCGYLMTLWNPSTRESRPLPLPPPIIPPYFYESHTFGFGLDPLTGSYKVIWIRYLVDNRTENPLPYFVVAAYTLGSDTWRYLDPLISKHCPMYRDISGPDFPDGTWESHTTCKLHNSYSSTYINGAYYWLVSYDIAQHSILYFDMSREVFTDISGPDHPDGTWGSLTLCNDSLALFFCQYGVYYQSIILLCVMKEEGCWDKLVTVEPFVEVRRPLGFWGSEELLLESISSELFLYKYDTLEIRNLGVYDRSSVFIYKQSLFSVNGQKKNPKEWFFSDTVADDLTFTVPAALVDKTEELAKLVECFSREQQFIDRRDGMWCEHENVDPLPEDDVAKGWQMIMDDDAKFEAFFNLDPGAKRNLYIQKLVRGGQLFV